MYLEYSNLSEALVGLSKALGYSGVWTRRGMNPAGNRCLEFPEPVMIRITNPLNRYVFVPERKWNKTLGWVESLWIARGDNTLEMPSAYVKNLLSFSDDGETMRAGYGPRIRNYGAHFVTTFYKNDESCKIYNQYDSRCMGAVRTTDQLKFIVDKFKQDITTREAVITIHDPIADDFNNGEVLITKDTPCTRSIHFMIVDGKMNCYVDMRSNDLFWGFSAVNVFNFTLMQEYVAALVGVPVGDYYHKVDNLHIYEGSLSMMTDIINAHPDTKAFKATDCIWDGYYHQYTTLKEFDDLISLLTEFEEGVRGVGDLPYGNQEALDVMRNMFDHEPMFMDWAKVFYHKWTKQPVKFDNPYLNKLF